MDMQVSTDYVRQGAGGTSDAATTALDNLRNSLDSSIHVAASHHGWASSSALQRCATAWENHMLDLAKQMNSMADGLQYAARDYDNTDQQIEEAMNRLHRGVSDLGKA
ncbi:type VII secretion target [Streptomyces silvisoli]|uniref:Type VII secretion target n=1 Tax=Streptomyces silvisoli TaxID=3034235 RepID=A0ABT5ZWY1_9ACTN|nr:type VII secretion target [Streptomyces silvisoli]MDF3294333.1 type VII secretion target [Streptomyces silvisoli]